jgi:hypothetical protein
MKRSLLPQPPLDLECALGMLIRVWRLAWTQPHRHARRCVLDSCLDGQGAAFIPFDGMNPWGSFLVCVVTRASDAFTRSGTSAG